MNYENVTLCKLALASTMYDSLTPFNYSLGRLNEATGGSIDLANRAHRLSLMEWLNNWGCRHLSKDQHDVASNSILNWYQVDGASLFTNEKPLWDLGDHELEIAARAYGSLKDKTGAQRVRGGSKQEVHIGPTAASKILFAIRLKALMPWDEAMRISFECDGSPESYFKYLITIRNLTLHIGDLCRNKGFQIDDLPQKLERPNSTVLALVNEYIWVTETRKVELPSSETLTQWASLG
ncbi:MAG: hypothetical protein DDT32_00786 [Syntrophomonadaceae bacterium]|nr:hypothetical protein [Bacillota bacterium]MBT9147034.1 hypothetical protein [Bacillota bacterium]